MPQRLALEGIIHVLKQGISWKSLPKSRYGCASSVHAYFKEWDRAGLFNKFWENGLAQWQEMEGVRWEWTAAEYPIRLESPNRKKRAHAKLFWRPVIQRRRRKGRIEFPAYKLQKRA